MSPRDLAKILPQTAKQFELLTNLRKTILPVKPNTKSFANAMVFFVNDKQQQVIENTISAVLQRRCKKNQCRKKCGGTCVYSRNALPAI
jgi:hypothetical protein